MRSCTFHYSLNVKDFPSKCQLRSFWNEVLIAFKENGMRIFLIKMHVLLVVLFLRVDREKKMKILWSIPSWSLIINCNYLRKGDHLGIDQTNYIWLDKVAGWAQTRNCFWKEERKGQFLIEIYLEILVQLALRNELDTEWISIKYSFGSREQRKSDRY